MLVLSTMMYSIFIELIEDKIQILGFIIYQNIIRKNVQTTMATLTANLNIKFCPETLEEIKQLCKERESTPSQLMRLLAKNYLHEVKAERLKEIKTH